MVGQVHYLKISGRKNLLLVLAMVLVLLIGKNGNVNICLGGMVLTHLAVVALDARRCGFVNDKNTAASPVESEHVIFCVLSMYPCS